MGEISIPADSVTCSGTECPDRLELDQNIKIATSETIANSYLDAIVEEYASYMDATVTNISSENGSSTDVISDNQDRVLATIDSKVSNAADAFEDLLNGDSDLIFTERRANNEEISRFLAADLGDLSSSERETIWALDGAVVVSSPKNPIKTLSLVQTVRIFTGAISNWSDIGGPDLPIKVYLPSETADLFEFFAKGILGIDPATFADDAERSLTGIQIDAKVGEEAGAIGLISTSAMNASKELLLESRCGLESWADSFSIRSESYPMTRRLYAYTTNRRVASHLQDLMALLLDEAGQRIVTESGFTSLTEEVTDMNSHGQQLAYSLSSKEQELELIGLIDFAREMRTADRLSTTLRFTSGSSQLDNKSSVDVVRLAQLLQKPEYQDNEVFLVGFSDSIGKSSLNEVLSLRRARKVRDAMLAVEDVQLDPNAIKTAGFGAAFPAACNNTALGRQINRRVDVWIR